MKIAFNGLDVPEGKVKYEDPVFVTLAEKFQPRKLSPYYFEFLRGDYESAMAIAMSADKILDLLILDMEKIENRMAGSINDMERQVLNRCLEFMEEHHPVCDMQMNDGEKTMLRSMNLLSMRPTIVCDDPATPVSEVCRRSMEKAGYMFFYTVGKQEVHAWFTEAGSDAVTCADRIHSDLARGFIKAEIASYDDVMAAHSFQDARARGLTKLVDRDFIIPEKTIVDIRFNV